MAGASVGYEAEVHQLRMENVRLMNLLHEQHRRHLREIGQALQPVVQKRMARPYMICCRTVNNCARCRFHDGEYNSDIVMGRYPDEIYANAYRMIQEDVK